MIAEERSRYAIRPFESAAGKPGLEVSPSGLARQLEPGQGAAGGERRREALLDRLGSLSPWPLRAQGEFRRTCHRSSDALDAVIAARCAAVAALTHEADLRPEDLAPGEEARIRREGWIYVLGHPARD